MLSVFESQPKRAASASFIQASSKLLAGGDSLNETSGWKDLKDRSAAYSTTYPTDGRISDVSPCRIKGDILYHGGIITGESEKPRPSIHFNGAC